MKKSLIVGMTIGILCGAAALITEYMIGWVTGLWFEELNFVSIMLSSIIVNLAGAFIFKRLDRKTSRAFLYYGLVVAGVTGLLTINVIVNPPQEQFGVADHPVHIVVALLSFWLIPKWMRKEKPVLQENPQAKVN
ncbi:hypothetical protein [Halobacillus litoralis]|uniref:hypothetical protein n=1 Tax=Halobacillus litoralis TaxID=45668 RepID=UPI0024906EEF|nr:hypothetical protein [Halobacillus litoralis]